MIDLMKIIRTTLGASARVVLANLIGRGSTGQDQRGEPYNDAEVFQPLGVAARPKLSEGTEALVFRIGREVFVLCQLDKSMTKYVQADLDEGEVLLYGPAEPGSQVAIRKAGNIAIKAKEDQNIALDVSGTGKVVVNGGNAKVSRVGDATAGHTHTVVFALTAGPTTVTGTITLDSATDTMAEGADNFEA